MDLKSILSTKTDDSSLQEQHDISTNTINRTHDSVIAAEEELSVADTLFALANGPPANFNAQPQVHIADHNAFQSSTEIQTPVNSVSEVNMVENEPQVSYPVNEELAHPVNEVLLVMRSPESVHPEKEPLKPVKQEPQYEVTIENGISEDVFLPVSRKAPAASRQKVGKNQKKIYIYINVSNSRYRVNRDQK